MPDTERRRTAVDRTEGSQLEDGEPVRKAGTRKSIDSFTAIPPTPMQSPGRYRSVSRSFQELVQMRYTDAERMFREAQRNAQDIKETADLAIADLQSEVRKLEAQCRTLQETLGGLEEEKREELVSLRQAKERASQTQDLDELRSVKEELARRTDLLQRERDDALGKLTQSLVDLRTEKEQHKKTQIELKRLLSGLDFAGVHISTGESGTLTIRLGSDIEFTLVQQETGYRFIPKIGCPRFIDSPRNMSMKETGSLIPKIIGRGAAPLDESIATYTHKTVDRVSHETNMATGISSGSDAKTPDLRLETDTNTDASIIDTATPNIVAQKVLVSTLLGF